MQIDLSVAELRELIADPVVDSSDHSRAQFCKDLMVAVRDNAKIPAIKAVRSLTGYGLKESKDLVESVLGAYVPTY